MSQTTIQPVSGAPLGPQTRPFRPHLARLKDALHSLGIQIPSAKIQAMAAAFYGFGSINALAAALKKGDLTVPQAEAATGQESLILMRDPVTGRVFGVDADRQDGLIVSPYGTLLTALKEDRGLWPGESQRALSLRMARRAFAAYAEKAAASYDDEDTIAALIADLLRMHQELPDDGQDERDGIVEVAGKALRTFHRECLGEVSGVGEPDIMVSIDDLDWDLAWTRDKTRVEAAAQAYAPGMMESEPDYVAADLIGDLLHMTAAIDHGSPIEALRKALQSLDRANTLPQVTLYTSIGR
jgi:hypothetical protein